jgi:hypothetical protein
MGNNTIKIVVAIIGVIGVTFGALITTGVISPKKIIEFKVIDAKSKQPIENAIVKLENDSKPTLSDGNAVFNVMKKGRKNYSITKEKYKQFNGIVKITGKENFQEVQLSLAEPDIVNPTIVFGSPKDESIQISPVSLTGTSKNLPQGKHFWIVVNPHGSNGWWPQTSEIMIKPNGKWSGVALLGGDKGKKFDIHFILADNQAHNEFNEYLTECTQTKKYPEKPLPSGSNSLGYLTITKK